MAIAPRPRPAPDLALAALALLSALGVAGCRLAPEGSCAADADCRPGRHCAEDVCVPDGRSDLYAGCVVDRDCDPFAECSRGLCLLLPGRCADSLDCQVWESCDATACTPLPGRCTTLDDCAAWEICVAAASPSTTPPLPEHRCALVPGRCVASTDCAAWQQCAASHFCETAAGACAVQDDCPPDRVCQANACVAQPAPPALDPAQVHLVGTVAEGTPGRAAIAPLGSPASKLVGLAAADVACGERLAPGGGVLVGRGAGLATLVSDPFTWSAGTARWTYPATPAANDVAVPPPAGCALTSVVLQAGTGARLFECAPLDWWDAAGTTIVSGHALLAWNGGGMKLAGALDMAVPPVLLDASGAPVPVVGIPAGRVVAWRADGPGFRVVVAAGAAGDYSDLAVWTVDAAGTATLVGALPALPAAAASVDVPLLDQAGAVYQLGLGATGNGLVVKRVPGPGPAVVAYDEATLPAGTTLLDAPVRVDASSCLVTGP